ncbi:hypothetical protein OG453_07435 [Streptomyces sp. NBC_01381]|uniref:hypothetical protein n=1 Tax=Streptomyces sp. NBC_01381 TaxID=2903845 RepID=UPI002252CD55|nr:hypothetical protein [Streptomyces sp. NBC_01381]MCX4666501.1 hypothetical protein [Streptomyces sp. NBC_01381]
MGEIEGTAAFEELAARTTAELLARSLGAEPSDVKRVIAHSVKTIAAQLLISPVHTLRCIEPSVMADVIAEAAGMQHASPGALQPSGDAGASVSIPRWVTGHQVMALAQAAKYSSGNQDVHIVQVAVDLLTEIGAACIDDPDSAHVIVPAHVLTETARVLDYAASQVETGAWTGCSCGDDHGQAALDAEGALSLRSDASLARQLASQAPV